MRKIITLTLMLALSFVTTNVLAQKSAFVKTQEVLMAMPETEQMQKDLEAFRNDFAANLEAMQVELNNKIADYQANESTMNASVRALKEKDMQDLDTRMRQFEQSAMQEIQAKQNELVSPIIAKVREAVSAAAKAGGYAVVYDAAAESLIYYDESIVIDLTPAVRVRLNLTK